MQLTVRPDKGSLVTVSNGLPSDECTVCSKVGGGVNDTQTTSCSSILALEPEKEVELLFNCPVEQSYVVTFNQLIGGFTDVDVESHCLSYYPTNMVSWKKKKMHTYAELVQNKRCSRPMCAFFTLQNAQRTLATPQQWKLNPPCLVSSHEPSSGPSRRPRRRWWAWMSSERDCGKRHSRAITDINIR